MVTGGCLCGAVRYEYDGPVGPATYCHCADCRRVTGSAFNVGVRFERARFRLLQGVPKTFTKVGGSGRTIERSFCPSCGSPLYTAAPQSPAFVWVKAGSLDAGASIEPVDQIWTESRVPWGTVTPDLPGHARNRPA
ncbi:MAG TPA: GFA family protein [Polyangiaceae bacterium]|nr:GFA family protein [Polyangiaceae bacterium]